MNNEQFALAMWFVARCLKGIEPPPTLTPEMVPPSFRSTKPTDGLVVSLLELIFCYVLTVLPLMSEKNPYVVII